MSQTVRNIALNFPPSQVVQLDPEAIILGIGSNGALPTLLVQCESAPLSTVPVELVNIAAEELLPEDGSTYTYIGPAERPAGQVWREDGSVTTYTGGTVYFFRRTAP